MKKYLAIVLAIIMILSLCACKSTDRTSKDNPSNEKSLSGEYDKILSCGYDKNGNYYALVATQEEHYDGYEIKCGVIKNNAWLVPLTSEFPFLDENGLFRVPGPAGGSKECDLDKVGADVFYFVDEGGFFINSPTASRDSAFYWGTGIFYNCDKQEYKNVDLGTVTSISYRKTMEYVDGVPYNVMKTENGKIVISHSLNGIQGGDYEIYIFNFSKMSMDRIVDSCCYGGVGPISEGTFAVIYSYNDSVQYFYNTDGKLVIDLSDYPWYRADTYHFENGEYSFFVKNDLGHVFKITIDSTGKVINEEKV